MALWFDPRGKSYAGDHTSTWLKAYVEQKLEENARRCEANLHAEAKEREDADLDLHKEIEAERVSYQAEIAEEATARQLEDGKLQAGLDSHKTDTDNPHEVTKVQIGLDNVDNTSDVDKPVSIATQAALNEEKNVREGADTELQAAIDTETADRQTEDSKLQAMLSAETEVRADADSALQSKINQETQQRQTAIDTEEQERTAADSALQAALNTHKNDKTNPHSVTKAQVGLGNVNNTADLDKPVSTATQAAINAEKSAREDADADLETALAQKAAKTEVLTKTNTTAFTPSGNYQPATKKYVDDSVSAAGGGDMLKSVYDADNDGKVNSAENADYSDDADKLGGQLPSYYATASAVNAKANTTAVLTKTNTTSFTPTSNYHPATKKYVDDSVSGKANTSAVLTKTNTTAFTPSGNYHPATKKYVDDAVANVSVFPERPALTALTPVGTTVGSSGWTGTGEFRVANQNTTKLYADDDLTGFKRINLKLASGENWREWSAYYDYNGVEYEFYYSESRGVYETLLPADGKTVAEIVDAVRWVYKCTPNTIRYGASAEAFVIKDTSETDTPKYDATGFEKSPSLLAQIGCNRRLTITDTVGVAVYVKGSLEFHTLALKHRIKLYLTLDVEGKNSITGTGMTAIMSSANAGYLLGVEAIDNWGA